MTWRVIHADCLDAMRELEESSVDAIVTDPPYGLRFMGKAWDVFDIERAAEANRKSQERRKQAGTAVRNDDFAGAASKAGLYDLTPRGQRGFQQEMTVFGTEALRVLKPGAHLLSFGGTRTYHRLACALEDAGFEIRDCLAWLYGSGFPKSLNLNGEWQGWGTALKPAFEPIVLARKPLSGTVAQNVLEYGTGALNVDGTRIGNGSDKDDERWYEWRRGESVLQESKGMHTPGRVAPRPATPVGRWPANVLLDPEAAEMLGTESRFFYTAKTSRAERERGVRDYGDRDEQPMPFLQDDGRVMPKPLSDPRMDREQVRNPARNNHPTVKPVDLMQWLCRLITPPKGLVLDPFLGSGSTGIAALREGFDFLGIEREAEYVEIARARIVGDAPLFNVEEVIAEDNSS